MSDSVGADPCNLQMDSVYIWLFTCQCGPIIYLSYLNFLLVLLQFFTCPTAIYIWYLAKPAWLWDSWTRNKEGIQSGLRKNSAEANSIFGSDKAILLLAGSFSTGLTKLQPLTLSFKQTLHIPPLCRSIKR